MVRRVFALMLCCACLGVADCSWAAQRSFVTPSTDDLAESLRGFKESVSRLEEANAQFSQYNRELAQHIQQGKAALGSLSKDQAQLDKDAKLYGSKTERKSGELSAFETQIDDIKKRLQNTEEQIAVKQMTVQDRLRRQQVIWEQLAVVNDSGNSAQLRERNLEAASEILKEKTELAQNLQDADRRLSDLEDQVAYHSMLKQDPSVSIPKLTAQRDALRQKLSAVLSSSRSAGQMPAPDINELKKLNVEVNELAKKRSDDSNLLQMLESQYDKNEKLTKNSAEEKKLQDAINALKKDNKLLHQQAADLQFAMVDLDKRKAQLEKLVQSAR